MAFRFRGFLNMNKRELFDKKYNNDNVDKIWKIKCDCGFIATNSMVFFKRSPLPACPNCGKILKTYMIIYP